MQSFTGRSFTCRPVSRTTAALLLSVGLRERLVGELLVLELSGEIDVASAPMIDTRLLTLPVRDTVVDLGGVGFFSAAGISMLLRLRSRLQDNGNLLYLARPSPMIRWILDVVEVTGELPYRLSVEAAIDALTRRRD